MGRPSPTSHSEYSSSETPIQRGTPSSRNVDDARLKPVSVASASPSLAASEGDVGAAEAGFKRASSTFRELSVPLWIGVSLLEYAEWLVAEGRAAAAEALLTEARGTFERLEAHPWLGRTDRVGGLDRIPA